MTFNRFVRRLHLYLALLLVPWFLMYGSSALFLAHQGFGEQVGRVLAGSGYEEWSLRFEVHHPDAIGPGASDAEIRAFAARALDAHGLECSFDARLADATHIGIYCFTFRTATRLSYDLESRVLRAEDRSLRLDSVLATWHARSGFQQDSWGADLWAVMVDLVAASLLVWVVTGLIMWWQAPRLRRSGAVALVAGCLAFLFFVVGL